RLFFLSVSGTRTSRLWTARQRSRPPCACHAKARRSRMYALLHAVCSLWPLFSRDPLPDIGWAMEECSSLLLTRAQEAHHLDIHQRHLVQVQHRLGSVTLQLCLQGLQMRRLQVADQPERRVVLVNLPFNLACHLRSLLPIICAVDDR